MSTQTRPKVIARRITMPLFKLGLTLFLLLGVIVVVGQAIGIAAGDGAIATGVLDALGLPMTVAAGATGLLAFAMSYLYDWDRQDD
jgi:hypothetical protein